MADAGDNTRAVSSATKRFGRSYPIICACSLRVIFGCKWQQRRDTHFGLNTSARSDNSCPLSTTAPPSVSCCLSRGLSHRGESQAPSQKEPQPESTCLENITQIPTAGTLIIQYWRRGEWGASAGWGGGITQGLQSLIWNTGAVEFRKRVCVFSRAPSEHEDRVGLSLMFACTKSYCSNCIESNVSDGH